MSVSRYHSTVSDAVTWKMRCEAQGPHVPVSCFVQVFISTMPPPRSNDTWNRLQIGTTANAALLRCLVSRVSCLVSCLASRPREERRCESVTVVIITSSHHIHMIFISYFVLHLHMDLIICLFFFCQIQIGEENKLRNIRITKSLAGPTLGRPVQVQTPE